MKLPNYLKISILLFLTAVLLYYGATAIHMGVFGDEVYYFSRGELLLELITSLWHGEFAASEVLLTRIIDRGWFYPATSIFIVPALAISSSLVFIRIYMLMLNALLMLWIIRYIKRIWHGDYYYIILFLIPFSGTFIYSSFTCWGEAIAGKLLVLFALWWVVIFQKETSIIKIKDVFVICFITVLIYCFRKNYILVLPLLFFLTAVFSILKDQRLGPAIKQMMKVGLAFGFLFALFIGPWAYGMKLKYGEYMISTTSTYTSRIRSYGSVDLRKKIMAAVPKSFEKKNISLAMYHYYYELSKKENRTFSEVVSQDLSDISDDMTPIRYYSYVKKHFRYMLKSPNVFLNRWQKSYRNKMTKKKMNSNRAIFLLGDAIILDVNTLSWFALYVFAMVYAIVGFYWLVTIEEKVTFLILAAVFCASTIHPFFAQPHSRHTHGMLPFFFVIVGHVVVLVKRRINGIDHLTTKDYPRYTSLLLKMAAIVITCYALLSLYLFMVS